MNLFYPLGLLGLLGIVVLIIIYLIKPNFQQRIVSTTFVWKLSFKYKKKRLPINRFRNLIILLCQILIITMGAFILARPYLPDGYQYQRGEKIFIIDASASMLAIQSDGRTRFERAVEEAIVDGVKAIGNDDRVSVILANTNPETVVFRSSIESVFTEALQELLVVSEITSTPQACTFNEADIDTAMKLAESTLRLNPAAEIMFYTATAYESAIRVNIVDVSEKDEHNNREWNVAILEASYEIVDNYYVFNVDVASYNRDEFITVKLLAYGANGAQAGIPETTPEAQSIQCNDNKTYSLRFSTKFSSFATVCVFVEENDTYHYDNSFYLFGGQKEQLKILYSSPASSDFFESALAVLPAALSNRWEVTFRFTDLEEIATELELKGQDVLSGYDFYIFEYLMPDLLPTDGVVLMISPDKSPTNSGFSFDVNNDIDFLTAADDECRLSFGQSSQLMDFVNPSRIMLRRYKEATSYEDYTPLMYIDNPNRSLPDPVYLFKNTAEAKIGVLLFASSYADYTVLSEFPTILFNIINVCFPPTLKQYAYEVGHNVVFDQSQAVLNESRPELVVTGDGIDGKDVYNDGNYQFNQLIPGKYVITQKLTYNDRIYVENFFVSVSTTESNFSRIGAYRVPVAPEPESGNYDIYIYFAAALCALVLVERILHVKDEF